MLYNLLAIMLCCHDSVRVSAEETTSTISDTDSIDVEINDTQIDFDNKVSPTDPNQCPPPYETPVVPQQTADSLTQAGIPYITVSSPHPALRPPSIYTQPQATTVSFSRAEERPYPNHYYPPPYENSIIPQQTAHDDSYTQAGIIPYTAASSYYRRLRAATTRPYYGHSHTAHSSLTSTVDQLVPPVYLMPITSDGTAVLIRPPYYS